MKTIIRNILVPLDFSALSIAAIDPAKRLAERFGATVHLANVGEFLYPADFVSPAAPVLPYPILTYNKQSEIRVTEGLIRIAKRSGLSGTRVHVVAGSPPFDEICRLANELPADLIVMSTHGRTGLKHVLLGSTAERIVQHSPCPVYIVRSPLRRTRNGASTRLKKVLVPIDFSRCSLAGLRYAIDFAGKTGVKLVLLHVVAYRYTTNGWITYEITEATRAAEEDAARQIQKFVRAVKFGSVPFETVILSGNAVDKICDYADEQGIELIITSTHGRTGLKHLLMGSVAENVVRHARCSVLSVPSFPRLRPALPQPRATDERKNRSHRIATTPRSSIDKGKLTRKYRKLAAHPFPERRKTNRFRETHFMR